MAKEILIYRVIDIGTLFEKEVFYKGLINISDLQILTRWVIC